MSRYLFPPTLKTVNFFLSQYEETVKTGSGDTREGAGLLDLPAYAWRRRRA